MVDRIVPATTDADVSAAAADLGLTDQAMVITEPFTQWIIEDRFAGNRPDLAPPAPNWSPTYGRTRVQN